MPIKWETLITDGSVEGKISLHRLRKLVSIIMGVVGAIVVMVGLVIPIVPLDKMALVGAILVAPMTGGQIGDALHGKFYAARVQRGAAPDRRSSGGT